VYSAEVIVVFGHSLKYDGISMISFLTRTGVLRDAGLFAQEVGMIVLNVRRCPSPRSFISLPTQCHALK